MLNISARAVLSQKIVLCTKLTGRKTVFENKAFTKRKKKKKKEKKKEKKKGKRT